MGTQRAQFRTFQPRLRSVPGTRTLPPGTPLRCRGFMTPEAAFHVLVRPHPFDEQKKYEDAIRAMVEQVSEPVGRFGYESDLAYSNRGAVN